MGTQKEDHVGAQKEDHVGAQKEDHVGTQKEDHVGTQKEDHVGHRRKTTWGHRRKTTWEHSRKVGACTPRGMKKQPSLYLHLGLLVLRSVREFISVFKPRNLQYFDTANKISTSYDLPLNFESTGF